MVNYLFILCIFPLQFIYVRPTDLLACYKIRSLARVIHGAVIQLAEILGDLYYYEMKLLHCIRN